MHTSESVQAPAGEATLYYQHVKTQKRIDDDRSCIVIMLNPTMKMHMTTFVQAPADKQTSINLHAAIAMHHLLFGKNMVCINSWVVCTVLCMA